MMPKKSKKEKAAKDEPGSKRVKTRDKSAPKGAKTSKKAASSKAGGPDIAAVVTKVKAKAVDLASNPLVAEVVAATLVAAAAAIKDPKKARAIAASAGDELGRAAKGTEAGAAMWQLAMDVAKRSVSALSEAGSIPDAPTKKNKKKS
jgi:hypothetical protein